MGRRGHSPEKSPHEEFIDIIDDLPKEIEEIALGRCFLLSPDQVFVIGESFGGCGSNPCIP
jgi:hypothetical protein